MLFFSHENDGNGRSKCDFRRPGESPLPRGFGWEITGVPAKTFRTALWSLATWSKWNIPTDMGDYTAYMYMYNYIYMDYTPLDLNGMHIQVTNNWEPHASNGKNYINEHQWKSDLFETTTELETCCLAMRGKSRSGNVRLQSRHQKMVGEVTQAFQNERHTHALTSQRPGTTGNIQKEPWNPQIHPLDSYHMYRISPIYIYDILYIY